MAGRGTEAGTKEERTERRGEDNDALIDAVWVDWGEGTGSVWMVEVGWATGREECAVCSEAAGSGVAGEMTRIVWRGVQDGDGRSGRDCSMSTTTLSFRRPSASYETNTRSAKAERDWDREWWMDDSSDCMTDASQTSRPATVTQATERDGE